MKQNRLIWSAAAVLLCLTAAFRSSGYVPGNEAMDFELVGTDDKNHSLKQYTDAKGFIVVFTCNHCPFAKYYEDRIIALDKKYKDLGYPVIAINPNDTAQYPEDNLENMKMRAAEKGFTFPYLWDETQNIARTYGAEKTPHVYVLQKKKSKLEVAYIGAIDNNTKDAAAVTERYVENAVDALLNGKKVEVKTTKAIGCTIKWKQ